MPEPILSPEQGIQLQRLREDFLAASQHADAMLQRHGMLSPEFAKADAAKGSIWRQIRVILGTAGESWMA